MNQSRWRGTSPGLSSACWMNEPTLPGKNWFNCWTNVSIYWLPAISISRIRLDWWREKGKRHDRGRKVTSKVTSGFICVGGGGRGRGVTLYISIVLFFSQERHKSNAQNNAHRKHQKFVLTRHDYIPRSPGNMSKACLFSGSVSRLLREIFDTV